ncbi:MAG: hypothetical protein JWP75_4156 [Frondihabitans sp.]|nr:hypothetical protein [Frondihabitans sp.]
MNAYPNRIRLSETAENYIDQLGTDLVLGNVELTQLPPSLFQFWIFAWNDSKAAVEAQLNNLEYELARAWFEVSRRKAPAEQTAAPDYKSFEQWQESRRAMVEAAAGHFPGGDVTSEWVAT